MEPEKSPLGEIALWLGIPGLALLIFSFKIHIPGFLDDEHLQPLLFVVGLFVITWAIVFAVGEVIIRELREQELIRGLVRDSRPQ